MTSKTDLYKYNFSKQVSRSIHELVGISSNILFDKKITDEEIFFLEQWLAINNSYLTEFPLLELNSLVGAILKDKMITESERKHLYDFLDSIAPSVEVNPVIENIFSPITVIEIKSNRFLFTGEMIFADRNRAETFIVDHDGILEKSCTLALNYLIVGSGGSESWKFGRFGTKITKALELNRQKKSSIAIVKENVFVKSIMN